MGNACFENLKKPQNFIVELYFDTCKTIETFQRDIMLGAATACRSVWTPCCDMFGVVGRSLKLVKFQSAAPYNEK